MKKIFLILFLFFITLFSSFSFAGIFTINDENDFPYKEENANSMKDILMESNIDKVADAYLSSDVVRKEHPMAYYASKVINYFLGLLAFFTVLVLIYGFSLVFTDKSDEGIKKGYKYIKMSTIALVIIGVSWLFASWIFSIYINHVIK